MAATLDQVLAYVKANSSKLDALISEMGIVMSLQDDLAAATATLQAETESLLDSNAKLTAVLESMKAANVDPSIVAAFDEALGQHKTAVDNISALANPQPPA